MNKRIFLITAGGVLLFLALVLGGITTLSKITAPPSTILTSTECAPPCWHGFQPGATTVDQARSTLYAQEWVDKSQVSEFTRREQVYQIEWLFQRPAGDFSGMAYFEAERLTAVSILTTGSLTLAQAFQRLGTPELMWTKIGTGELREYLEIALLYPTKGFLIEVDLDIPAGKDQVVLKENSPVFRVTYFDPGLYGQLLDSQILIRWPSAPDPQELQPWAGLGAIPLPRK